MMVEGERTPKEGRPPQWIAATPENAPAMRAIVRAWPQLEGLVRGLQAQGCFPGLRALSIAVDAPPGAFSGDLGALCAPGGLLGPDRPKNATAAATGGATHG